MKTNELKENIKRLVDHANVIAPSIANFVKDGRYGSVTDENLMWDSLTGWEMEARALLNQLTKANPNLFSDLYKDYLQILEESKRFHSKSILVHQIQQLLAGAYILIESPLAQTSLSSSESFRSKPSVEENYAFIAMPMNPDDHSLIDVLETIKAAALQCGIRAERVDEPQSNERITDRIIESIMKAQFVIVDLTKSRPNVYFEAGFAHGLGKVPVYIAKDKTQLEFDLKDYPVIYFRNYKELREKLIERLNNLTKKQ